VGKRYRPGKWVKIEGGKRWRFIDSHGKILGHVSRTFDSWDAYLVTGKKWPESQESVTPHRHPFDLRNPFYEARRAVEEALC
jgi:hypothetical protein